MPKTPLTAVNRMAFRYTVAGMVHRQHLYLGVTPSGDPSGFDTVPRSGFAATGVSGLFDRFATMAAPLYAPSNMSFDGWDLEAFLSGHWVILTSGTSSVVATGSAANVLASMLAIVGRSGSLAPVRTVRTLYETDSIIPAKYTSFAVLGSPAQNLVNYYYGSGSTHDVKDAYVWSTTVNSIYLQSWISMVSDTNEKLRRKRGIK